MVKKVEYSFKLRKAPHPPNPQNHYWVINENGRKMSKDPLPKAKAEAQLRAIYASKAREGGAYGKKKKDKIIQIYYPRSFYDADGNLWIPVHEIEQNNADKYDPYQDGEWVLASLKEIIHQGIPFYKYEPLASPSTPVHEGEGLSDILSSIFSWLSPDTSKHVKGLAKIPKDIYKTSRKF